MKFWGYISLQAGLTLLYFIFRAYVVEGEQREQLERYEFNSLFVLGIVMFVRMIRIDSWLGYFVFGLKIVHVIMFGISFMFNAYFAVVFGILAILLHFGVYPPFFEVTQRVATLQDHLIGPYIACVPECYILFYATWEERSIAVTPVFGKIAEKYTTERRLFARFDIGRGDQQIQKRYNISTTNGTLRQLPTIVKFKEGKEVKRLDPNSLTNAPLNFPTIVKYFGLSHSFKRNSGRNSEK